MYTTSHGSLPIAHKPHNTPQYRVVTHRPGRRIWQWVGALGLLLGSVVLGFALGQNESITARFDNALLNRDLQSARMEVSRLESELIDARLAGEVQSAAATALRNDLTGLHEQVAALSEEVTFYKSLMAPSSLSSGLQIAELVLEPSGQGAFRYDLLLTQVALRRSYISGEVRLDLVGQQQGSEVVLSLTELSEPKTYPLKFRFRYFQDISGSIVLPEGFEPNRVLVTAEQQGKEPLQNAFPWQAATELQVAGG